MRTLKAIEADIQECAATGTQKQLDEYWFEWFRCLVISNEISPDRLAEICAAEKDGRCVVLPCKVGTPVYCLRVENVPDDDYRMSWHIKTRIVERPFDVIMWDAVGKTVFLTRPEAEAAMKGGGE